MKNNVVILSMNRKPRGPRVIKHRRESKQGRPIGYVVSEESKQKIRRTLLSHPPEYFKERGRLIVERRKLLRKQKKKEGQ